jgi:hypothetical protein
MNKTYYEIRDESDDVKITKDETEAKNALRNGKIVIKIQESVIFTEETVVRTTVSQQMKR